jgi:hypothetical protein
VDVILSAGAGVAALVMLVLMVSTVLVAFLDR